MFFNNNAQFEVINLNSFTTRVADEISARLDFYSYEVPTGFSGDNSILIDTHTCSAYALINFVYTIKSRVHNEGCAIVRRKSIDDECICDVVYCVME